MCIQAEVFRLRARNIALRFAQSTDANIRALADRMVRAYEALAQNEEWLSGAVSPVAVPIVARRRSLPYR